MKLSHILENRMRDKLKYGPQFYAQQQDYGNDWYAIDNNTYDGAPDSHPHDQLMGHGTSKNAAVLDLVDQLEEIDTYSSEQLDAAMKEMFPEPRRGRRMPPGAPTV